MVQRKKTWEITLKVQRHSDEPERLSDVYLPQVQRTARPVVLKALFWSLGAAAAGFIGYLIQALLT